MENSDIWIELTVALLILFEIVIKLIPTQKDNGLLKIASSFINLMLDWFIPSIKKGGGFHNKYSFWKLFFNNKSNSNEIK